MQYRDKQGNLYEALTFREFTKALKPRDFSKWPKESAAVRQMWADEFRSYAVAKDSDEQYRINIHGFMFGITPRHVVTIDWRGNVQGVRTELFEAEFTPV